MHQLDGERDASVTAEGGESPDTADVLAVGEVQGSRIRPTARRDGDAADIEQTDAALDHPGVEAQIEVGDAPVPAEEGGVDRPQSDPVLQLGRVEAKR